MFDFRHIVNAFLYSIIIKCNCMSVHIYIYIKERNRDPY